MCFSFYILYFTILFVSSLELCMCDGGLYKLNKKDTTSSFHKPNETSGTIWGGGKEMISLTENSLHSLCSFTLYLVNNRSVKSRKSNINSVYGRQKMSFANFISGSCF